MKDDRPKIIPSKTPLQQGLNSLALVALIGVVIIFLLKWPGLPDRIPHHFDIQGKPDAYGSKYLLMMFPLMSIVLYLFFSFLNKRPHTFNFPVPITEENAERQYTLAMNLNSAISAIIILIFFYLTWRTTTIVEDKASGLGGFFMPLLLAMIFVPIILYYLKANQKSV